MPLVALSYMWVSRSVKSQCSSLSCCPSIQDKVVFSSKRTVNFQTKVQRKLKCYDDEHLYYHIVPQQILVDREIKVKWLANLLVHRICICVGLWHKSLSCSWVLSATANVHPLSPFLPILLLSCTFLFLLIVVGFPAG